MCGGWHMDKLPIECKLMKLVTWELRTIVSHYRIRNTISTEMLLEEFKHRTRGVLFQLLDFSEVGIEVHKHYVIFAMKIELVCSNSAPRRSGSSWLCIRGFWSLAWNSLQIEHWLIRSRTSAFMPGQKTVSLALRRHAWTKWLEWIQDFTSGLSSWGMTTLSNSWASE